jgi:hypothetical protein
MRGDLMKEAGILLYNLGTEKGEQINQLCTRLNIKVRWIKTEEFHLPLADLINFKSKDLKILKNSNLPNSYVNQEEFKEGSNEGFRGEMFVMVNFSEELLDRFLREYKLKQIEPVFLKAILTPHNKSWSSNMLNKELMRERLEMSLLNHKK